MNQGIFGIVDFRRTIENSVNILEAMNIFSLKSRMSKGQLSYITNANYLLGMKRICNKSSLQQDEIAQINELQALSLICGEIHNYSSVVKDLPGEVNCGGDLDLFIHLYRAFGPKFARKLNGLFSLAILDQQESSLIILNDRFGMAHQVYWTMTGSRFYFATHIKTLLILSNIKKEIDFEALNLFLKYSYIPSPWTILKGIRKLAPGHLLIFKEQRVSANPFWEFSVPSGEKGDFQEAIRTYKELLKKSISKRLSPNGKTGILLSGGLDSSANVALAAESTGKKLLTFSVGFEDPAFDERPYAKIVAQHFNTQHYETSITGDEIEDLPKLVWHMEEPYFEFGLFLTYAGLSAAQKEVDTVIGGEGADQLFGTGGFAGGRPVALHYLLLKYHLLPLAKRTAGIFKKPYFYDYDNLAFKLRLLWQRSIDLNNWYFYGFDHHELLKLYKNPGLATIPRIFPDGLNTEHFNTDLASLHPTPYTLHPSFEDLFLQTQINQDLKHYVNENVMVKSGRMADMLGLTLRESFLDTEVTDFLTSLDFSFKRKGGLFDHLRGKIKTKYLHRKAMEDLLPSEIMQKPKQGGFVPVMIFLKNPEMRKKIYYHLLDSKGMKEYFRPDYLKNLFEGYEHMQGRQIYWHNFYNAKANQILFLLTFDIWHHFYVRNNFFEVDLPLLSLYFNSKRER